MPHFNANISNEQSVEPQQILTDVYAYVCMCMCASFHFYSILHMKPTP
jgi:hypothetical protein